MTSDVVWDDLFQAPAQGNGGVLEREGITGVAVPGSNFVPSPDYASSRYWEAILQRLQGAATSGGTTGGGLHGTGIVKTVALPANQELLADRPRTRSPPRPTSVSRSRSRTPATRRRCRSR